MRAATTRARCTSNGGNWGTQGDWQLAGDDECLVCLGRRSEQTPQTPADTTRAKLQNAVAWGSKSQQQPFKSRKHAAADKRVGGRLQVRTRTDGDSDKQPKKKKNELSSIPASRLLACACFLAFQPTFPSRHLSTVAARRRRHVSRTVCQRPWRAQHQHGLDQSLVSLGLRHRPSSSLSLSLLLGQG